MEKFAEPLVWVSIPVIIFVISVTVLKWQGKRAPKALHVALVFSIFSSALVGSRCMCTGMWDQIIGAITFASIYNVILFAFAVLTIVATRNGTQKLK